MHALGMQLHPKNLDFCWQEANLRPSAPAWSRGLTPLSAELVEQYNKQGAFILPEAFSAAEVYEVTAALDPLAAEANAALADQPADQPSIAREDEIVFSAHVVTRSALLQAFAQHPVLQQLCYHLLGDNVRLYWDQLVYKNPDTPDEFPWHQDNGYTYVEPQQYLTCWIALTDATVDNGCPWIVPGMHKSGTLKHQWTNLGFECLRDPANAVPLELAAGSIAVFSSLTPHRTGPNLTTAARKSYILQYAPDGAQMFPYLTEPQTADNTQWQFPVLQHGEPATRP